MSSNQQHPDCAVCHLPTVPRSRHCAAHTNRLTRYGHPEGCPMSDRLLRLHTRLAYEWIEATATLPPTKAALQIAEELLRISPLDASEKSREALSWVIAAVDGGLTSRELLARVVAVYWLIHDHHTGARHSRTKQEEDVAVARWALRLAARERRRRLPARVSRHFGDLLRRGLARYSLALLAYRKKTEAARRALVDRSATFG